MAPGASPSPSIRRPGLPYLTYSPPRCVRNVQLETRTMPDPLDGRFVWHELLTSDPDAAKAFYTAVLG